MTLELDGCASMGLEETRWNVEYRPNAAEGCVNRVVVTETIMRNGVWERAGNLLTR